MSRIFEKKFTVYRVLEDGQHVFVAGFDQLQKAQETISSLSEFWPGDYTIHSADSFIPAERTPSHGLLLSL
jgi:hypothetical protein